MSYQLFLHKHLLPAVLRVPLLAACHINLGHRVQGRELKVEKYI